PHLMPPVLKMQKLQWQGVAPAPPLLEIAAEVFEGAFEARAPPLQGRDALAIGRAALRWRGLRLFRHLDIAGQQLRPALFLVPCLARQFLDEPDLRQSL